MNKSKQPTIDFFTVDKTTNRTIPFVSEGISAGFPSPAADFLDDSIDLNKFLLPNSETTFCGRVRGNSMIDAGIHNGDILVIDKSLEPLNNEIAVCYIDSEFTVKRIKIEKNVIWLIAENKEYEPIKVTKDNEFIIWGVVTYIIKKPK